MPRVVIDNRPIEVPAGATILDAASALGIEIPTLCFLKGYEPATSCLVCMVKLLPQGKLAPACATVAVEGMQVESDTPEVYQVRRTALELLFSDHVGDCLAPCHFACPAHMDVPTMLRQISDENLREAIVTVKHDIALPAVLGRICPKPCEKGCRRGSGDGPVAVCQLKRFVADADMATGNPYVPECQPATGKRVAIIGAGPAGLSAAYYLAQQGHACTVLEREARAGGRLWHESNEQDLPRNVLEAEVAALLAVGVHLQHSCVVDAAKFAQLTVDFDAVLIAAGSASVALAQQCGIPTGPKGIEIDRRTYQTRHAGVFAAGNALRARGMVVRSVADGKEAATAIDQHLKGGPLVGASQPFSSRIGKVSSDELASLSVCAHGAARCEPESNAGFARKDAVEQASRCLHCDCRSLATCKLRMYAEQYGADASRFESTRRPVELHYQHSDVLFEPGKCIQCGLCIQIAARAGEPLGLAFVGRGFDVRVGVPFDGTMADALRKVAAECVAACPTAAIAFKRQPPAAQLPIVNLADLRSS